MFVPQIIKSRRSSLTISINPDGEVIVKVPLLVPKFIINNFIREKSDWIEKTLAKINKRKPNKKRHQEGEFFLFLGQKYKLKFDHVLEVQLKNGEIIFPHAAVFRIEKEMTNWYIRKAQEIISKRVEFHAQRMHASYKDLRFSDTRSKWGTCFRDNSLQFSWRLVMAPLMVLDYVVIHELVHTTEKNHKDTFWGKVRLYTPAYKQHRKWLEENAHLLIN